MGEDDVTGDCDVGGGTVTAGSGVGDDGNTGDCDVGDGAVLAGGGSGEDISGEACVHPADSNITSVSGIRIIDSFFIFILLHLALLDPPCLVSQLYIT